MLSGNPKFEPTAIQREKRYDIQALRGLAVIFVLLYHADFGFPSGFLGVDIFFVISGYLITGIIASQIVEGRFSLKDFYMRRARRLLPASYALFAAVAILAPWFLTRAEMNDLARQLLASVTFSANFYFKQEVDYFGPSAATQPLLHVWSLSLEEQFYFLFPAFLLIVRPKYWCYAVALIFAISLALCFGGLFSPRSTFFLLPSRVWELALGSLVALTWPTPIRTQATEILKYPALVILCVVPMIDWGGRQPGTAALLATCATALILVRRSKGSGGILTPIAKVGDFSYSLYLVHWPIIIFVRNAWLTPNAMLVNAFGVLLSLAAGYVLYRFVEVPFRNSAARFKASHAGGLLAAAALVLLTGWSIRDSAAKYQGPTHGLGSICEVDGSSFAPSQQCLTAPDPEIIVWGDSFAMHLIPGLLAEKPDIRLVQATKSVCGPTLGLAPFERRAMSSRNQQWAKKCISFNASVLDYLRQTPSIRIVVLSNQMAQYLRGSTWGALTSSGRLDAGAPSFLASLSSTAEQIRALGKRIVFVAPPPAAFFDIQACVERRSRGGVLFGPNGSCQITRADYRLSDADLLEVIDRIPDAAGIPVIRLEPAICDELKCTTSVGHESLFADKQHLSASGSRYVASRIGLLDKIEAEAR